MTLFDPLGLLPSPTELLRRLFPPSPPFTREEVQRRVVAELSRRPDISSGVARKAAEWAVNYYDGQLGWFDIPLPHDHPLRGTVGAYALKGASKYAKAMQVLIDGGDPDTT